MLLAYFFAMSFSLRSFASGESYFYVVKKSDMASSILYRSGLKPIYKKDGFLKRLQRVNPEIADLNQIFPGQKISFSKDLIEKGKALGLIGLTTENEIYFIDQNSTVQSNSKLEPVPKDVVQAPTIEKSATENQVTDLPKPKVERKAKGYLALGSGFTFLSFTQNGSETKKLEYSSLTGQSFSLRGGAEWISGYGFDASYAAYPGQLKSSTNAIGNSCFTWTAQSLETTYRINKGFEANAHYHVRAGIQHHDLPYVQLPTVSTADVRKHEVYMATLGVDYNFELSEKWRSQILLRYQIPFSQSKSADDIQFQNQFAFDGSLGASYQVSSHFNFGVFWYGQWQEFNYSMLSEATSQKDNGKNKFFFSNLELRLGFDF